MNHFPRDLFAESAMDDGDTLAQLGPLRAMAGTWTGSTATDVKPTADGAKSQAYVERYELQPVDPQKNGPQTLFGLRYHTFIHKPGFAKTYHDQVGYWLWEPATGTVMHTLAIPRGQIAMATGHVDADATSFVLTATRGSLTNGIVSNPFLEEAFTTLEWRVEVTVHPDGSWSYLQDTTLQLRGVAEPFHHTDRNTLIRVAEPVPNPRADAIAPDAAMAS